jgi:predicted nucleic acid-binding protein
LALLVDTGVLYALADRDDAWHSRVRKYLTAHTEPLLAPVTVLPEVTYLLRERIGARAERAFVESLSQGELAIEPLTQRDIARAADVLATYDTLGFVDATVVAVAERLNMKTMATTDRRHFSIIRPAHVERFILVP